MRLIDSAGSAIASRSSRRGFLTKSTLVGTALAAAPATYVLKPGTAYAAVCGCNGSSCDCSAGCCDGYTEFCCTLTGQNTCPEGSVPAGWWKVDASGFCNASGTPGPRYYLDCNAVPSGPCSPRGVTRATDLCNCGCAQGSCGNRKSCCTAFRYGQCSQQIACLGPIVCRVVTCTPPWEFDPTCTTASATDENTRSHHRPCLERPTPERGSLPAMFNDGRWTLGYSLDSVAASSPIRFRFGQAGDIPVMGDWNGDGVHTVGVVRGNRWLLRNSNTPGPPHLSFSFGAPDDIPVVGDWTGSGRTGIGMKRKRSNRWRLRNRALPGRPDIDFRFGGVNDIPITGDWNNNGISGVGVVRENARRESPSNQIFLRNTASAGRHDRTFYFGNGKNTYLFGDWNGTGSNRFALVKRTGLWRFKGGPSDQMRFGKKKATTLIWQAANWTPGRLPR